MKTIRPCRSCAAPLTLKMVMCPHCNTSNPPRRLARLAATIAGITGGLTLSSTLSACYGAPCANGGTSCLREVPADAAVTPRDAGSLDSDNAAQDAASTSSDNDVTPRDLASDATDARPCSVTGDGGDRDAEACDAEVGSK